MKRHRWTLLFGSLLLVWLAFGPQLVQRLATPQLFFNEGMPPGITLEGSLYFTQAFDGIRRVDLTNGVASSWWQPPEGGLVTGLTASPDGTMLAVSYAPPAAEGYQTGTTDLYLTPTGQPDMQPLFIREGREESYRDPAWSPAGEWLYYTHLKPASGSSGVELTVERISFHDNSAPEIILRGAEQAALSPDNIHITYLKFDTRTYARDLMLARLDGTDEQTLIASAIFAALAGPLFSPDGRSVVFSASGEIQTAQAGIIVRAHGRPWNVWQALPEEDALIRLTPMTLDGPAVTWLPNQQSMAILAVEGIFIVHESLFYRLAEVDAEGEIAWAH